jgi:hypothetical protein
MKLTVKMLFFLQISLRIGRNCTGSMEMNGFFFKVHKRYDPLCVCIFLN